jgi:hypothetical protein
MGGAFGRRPFLSFRLKWGISMDGTAKKKFLAAAAAVGAMVASPAAAQDPITPVKIGVMDLEVKGLAFPDSNTKIEYQAFTPEGAKEGKQTTRSGEDHGVIVASAVVRQYRLLDPKSPVEVYAANPFGLTKNAKGEQFLKLDFKQAEKALEWMHSKGVRTVVTAFNSSNQLGSFNFMNKAEQLGMTVFAAYSNETGKGAVYPAADARTISVVDTNRGQLGSALVTGAGREKDALSAGITFAMHGGVPQGKFGNDYQTGSSFSSAKAAAYGAYILSRHPDATRDEIVDLMTKGSRPFEMETAGEKRDLPFIGDARSNEEFLAAAGTFKPIMASKETESANVAMLAAFQSKQLGAGR